ncbi:MAG: HEAT repeat domain-containing protein [Planctomycetota bacterium]
MREGSSWEQIAVSVVGGLAVFGAALILMPRESLPRREARPASLSHETAPRADAPLPSAGAAPVRIDPARLEEALRAAGVTPETLEEARGQAREEALATLRGGTAEPFAQQVAIFHLWNTKQVDDKAIDAILALLDRDPKDEGMIAEALYAMKDSPRTEVSATTQAFLRQSTSPAVRLAAVKSLHFRAGAEVTRSLAECLRMEGDEAVRRRIVVALGTRALDDEAAMGSLEETTRLSRDSSIRELAGQMLREAESLRTAMGKK